MDTNFDKVFGRFMWATECIFLGASMPHIAAWFAHYDHPTDFWSGVYAWGVGFLLAFAIDGVAFMLLLALTRMFKSGKQPNWLVMGGIFLFMVFIASVSWYINWQYDIQNADASFAKAETNQLFGLISVGTINPIIGGSFQVLILAYALIAKAMQTEVKPVEALDETTFQRQLKRIEQDQKLKAARKGRGIVGTIEDNAIALVGAAKAVTNQIKDGKETGEAEDELPEPIDLKAQSKSRTTDELEAINLGSIAGNEDDHEPVQSPVSGAEKAAKDTTAHPALNGLSGRDNVDLEKAAEIIGCSIKSVQDLRRNGKLKYAGKSTTLITVASIKSYLATRRSRHQSPVVDPIKPVSDVPVEANQSPATERHTGPIISQKLSIVPSPILDETVEENLIQNGG